MRVTDIETFVVDADWRNWFFVQVTTDDGLTGVGEALSGEGLTAALEAHKHGSTIRRSTPSSKDRLSAG